MAPRLAMGIFDDKIKIQVASVAYNMAGDLPDRISVLKSTVTRHVLLGEKKIGLGQRIVETQMSGPTMSQRAFFRWSRTHYTLGQSSGSVGVDLDIDDAVVIPHLGIPVGYEALVDDSSIQSADIELWARRHILLTRPADAPTDWIADYLESTNQVFIQYEDLSSETIPATGFVRGAKYVTVYYRLLETGEPETTAVPRLYLYRIGSGIPALDALYVPGSNQATFFPAIPLRIRNLPIDHASFASHYETIEKAYKKATGEKLSEILTSIEDNDNIDDVDYATLVFGVELTTQEKCGLRYLYEFFKGLIPTQTMTASSFAAWFGGSIPDPTVTPPTRDWQPKPKETTLKVNGADAFMAHHDHRLSWVFIDEKLGSGLGKAGAKSGELWIEHRPRIRVSAYSGPGADSIFNILLKGAYSIPHFRLFYQTSETTHKILDVYGLLHQNFVYGGEAVYTSSYTALNGEDDEGFIIPLHYPTLLKMPLLQANQLALSSRHVVFNCYNVVKVRWYQRGVFKILLGILISIVFSFIFPGATGLLGTALQVGTQAGLTGISAVILGATVNAIAAMALMTVIEKGSMALFGEELGALISSILSFFAAQAFGNFAAGGGFVIDWGSMMRIENLMGLLNASVNAMSKWTSAQIAGIQEDLTKLGETYKDDMEALTKKAWDLLGAGGGAIDPLMFTQTQSRFYPAESRDAFLQRTLMTGSDLIDLSMSMIEDFAEINLMLDKKIA